jgi:hypothetical protein
MNDRLNLIGTQGTLTSGNLDDYQVSFRRYVKLYLIMKQKVTVLSSNGILLAVAGAHEVRGLIPEPANNHLTRLYSSFHSFYTPPSRRPLTPFPSRKAKFMTLRFLRILCESRLLQFTYLSCSHILFSWLLPQQSTYSSMLCPN